MTITQTAKARRRAAARKTPLWAHKKAVGLKVAMEGGKAKGKKK